MKKAAWRSRALKTEDDLARAQYENEVLRKKLAWAQHRATFDPYMPPSTELYPHIICGMD